MWATPCAGDTSTVAKFRPSRAATGRKTEYLSRTVQAAYAANWPTPTIAGNYNRAGASPNAGDGLRTAAAERAFEQEPWEQGVPRTVAGRTPNRVPRLKALGNSVVPQVVEAIGRAILAAEAERWEP